MRASGAWWVSSLLFRYIKKRKFNGDITLRYLIWYGAGRFWIEALRTDSLMLVPTIGLRVSQLLAGIAVVGGVVAEILLTRKFRGKPLMVPLAMNGREQGRHEETGRPHRLCGGRHCSAGLQPAWSSLRKDRSL